MINTKLPVPHAFRGLQRVHLSTGVRTEESVIFALTWLAAARMVLAGEIPAVSKLEDLRDTAAWNAIERVGLTPHGVRRWLEGGGRDAVRVMVNAATIVDALVAELGNQPWDVLPILTSTVMDMPGSNDGMVSGEVAELMLDVLGEPRSDLWIPFDFWGVLSVRALRRGWLVNSAPMGSQAESPLPLLLAIETGRPLCSNLKTVVERDAEGRPITRAAHVLAVPPFGMNVRDSRLIQWGSGGRDSFDRYARSETWVVNELLNRVSRKAVFLLPPSFLFARGQEERLRERLMDSEIETTEVQSVVAMPGGAVSNTHMGTAIVSVTPGSLNESVLMVDLGMSSRSAGNIDELVRIHRDIALGQAIDEERSCRVTPMDIRNAETSFMPSRYLHKPVDVGPNAVSLDELCELVRPPMIARDENSTELLELGIPELGGWAPVQAGLKKTVRAKLRHGLPPPTLQEGDVVLSIKGTVGKAGLVGSIGVESAVVSQSCLGIRILPNKRAQISPEYLLMFLKSSTGQAQLESLQAGAIIQHVSPQSLLRSFMVPLPQATEQEAVETDYQHLCSMERDIEGIQRQMSDIAASRWAL